MESGDNSTSLWQLRTPPVAVILPRNALSSMYPDNSSECLPTCAAERVSGKVLHLPMINPPPSETTAKLPNA